ncbi:hypothetical protein [Halobacillus campisalis]
MIILKIIGIPIFVYGVVLLVTPFFDLDLGGQISITIPVTLMTYYEFLYARPRREG